MAPVIVKFSNSESNFNKRKSQSPNKLVDYAFESDENMFNADIKEEEVSGDDTELPIYDMCEPSSFNEQFLEISYKKMQYESEDEISDSEDVKLDEIKFIYDGETLPLEIVETRIVNNDGTSQIYLLPADETENLSWDVQGDTTDKSNVTASSNTEVLNPYEKPFQCDQCEKVYKYECQLRDHKRMHSGERPFVCNVCDKGFTSKNNLRSHEKRHSEVFSHVCPVCSKGFYKAYYLKVHMRKHTRERPAQCDICFKHFFSTASMQKHRRLHTGEKPFECDICGEKFSVKAIMQNHRNWHLPEKAFKCEICNSSFIRKETYKVHLIRHEKDKPFKCNVCSKGFCVKFELNEHMASHSDEAPFACVDCNRAFKTATRLRNHKKFRCNRPAWS